jgi:glycosyltransferase involved in cell wall biosynthesis
MWFTGNRPGVESVIYGEYLKLSELMKLVVLAKNGCETDRDNILIIKVPKSYKPFWTAKNVFTFTMAAIRMRDYFDLVYSRMLSPHTLVPGIVLKIIFRKRFVMRISGRGNLTRTNSIIFRVALRLADKICTPSPIVVEDFERHLGVKIDRHKVFFLKNYIDIETFKPATKEKTGNVIISVGRISREKGFEFLIEAAPHIFKAVPDIRIRIIGPIQDQSYYDELVSLTKKEGCESYVEFVGPVAHDEVSNYLAQSKVFVSTQTHVGTSNAITEAMSCGLPVVSTGLGSIPHSKGKTVGFIVADMQELTSKVVELLRDTKLREEIGTASRQLVEEKFNDDLYIRNLGEILRSTVFPKIG